MQDSVWEERWQKLRRIMVHQPNWDWEVSQIRKAGWPRRQFGLDATLQRACQEGKLVAGQKISRTDRQTIYRLVPL